MNIGSLYLVKKFSWLLFPTKEVASTHAQSAVAAAWSIELECNVTYFSPDSMIVFLEEDGKFKKVLTSEGLIGWTLFVEGYNHCFEEMKTES